MGLSYITRNKCIINHKNKCFVFSTDHGVFKVFNCHHQIVFAKFNLKVHYPPPYEREVWHFERAITDHIKRAINGLPWERSFANLDINDKVRLFNKTIRNILSNFIPHETITFDGRDPPWINSQVKQ